LGLSFAASVAAEETKVSEDAFQAAEVTIRSTRIGSTASRMDIPVGEVPATVNVIDQEQLRHTGAREWVSALRYTPGLMAIFTYGGFNSATVRGMQENDLVVLLDGVRDDTYNLAWSSPQGNLAGIESIEVLKGPNSLLYGTGALAGVINRIRKQPSEKAAYELGLGVGSFGSYRATFSATGPLGDLVPGLLYRLDYEGNTKNGFRQNPERRHGVALALKVPLWRGAQMGYHGTFNRDRYDHPDPGLPIDTAQKKVPINAPLDKNYGHPDDFLEFSGSYNQLTLDQKLMTGLRASVRVSYNPVDYEYMEAEVLDLAGTTITRDFLYMYRHHRPLLAQAELGWKGDGPFKHQGLVGYDFNHFYSYTEFDSNLNYSGYSFPTIDLLNPVETGVRPLPRPDERSITKQVTHSLYAQEWAEPLPWLKVLAAARFDGYQRSTSRDILDANTQETTSVGYVTTNARSAVTYRGGLVLTPLKGLNYYASYSTAFKPVLVRDSSDGRVDFEPEYGRQVEIGMKWEGLDGAVGVNLAVFDIVKSNVLRRIQNVPRLYDQQSEQYSNGFETELFLRPAEGFGIRCGYAYTDARKYSYNEVTQQKTWGRPYVVPMHSATVWFDAALGRGFSAGLGGRYVGDQFADDISNQILMPGYALADAGLYYTKDSWSAELTASNLLDQRRYFTSTITGNNPQLYPGEPLNIQLMGRYSF
jgi:iron complex outermembrane receptor protein